MSTENPTPEIEGTQAAYDCACQTEATLRAEVERLTKERDEARAENSRLGAPIEAAIWSLVNELGRASWSREIIARHMRALVASVTNSQQKGGEEPCVTTEPIAAPTSNPEGAATKSPSTEKQP